jgi:asparagine synthase (glutamine-hydrolysing)
MAAAIAHRGPDDHGIWWDPPSGVALSHRRLSIIDLSPHGHQPMHSADGRYVIVYNGEIYNHEELRAELSARRSGRGFATEWRGGSDTEVLLECIVEWGLADALRRCVGMFALALWDRRERRLYLARDRFGEKPLYYGWVGTDFVFGSELKAIRRHPRFASEVDREALRLYAARTYVPAPHSIYKRLFKLEPGCVLSLPTQAAMTPRDAAPRIGERSGGILLDRYWSYRSVVAQGLDQPILSGDEAASELDRVLSQAIAGQSVADVPVGAFLSGGIDSSVVVGMYQRHSPRPIRTFSIGFEEAAFDEAPFAKVVARHFGTDHNEHYVTVKQAQDVIPLLPNMYDEPFADSSQIPTYLVSHFARNQVVVALSGDGGDELFGGYNRHFLAPQLWEQVSKVPRPVRALVGQPLSRLPAAFWDGITRYLPGAERRPHYGTKVQKGLRLMGHARRFDDVYNSFLDQWSDQASPVLFKSEVMPDLAFDLELAPGASDSVRVMYCDAVSYLPDDILCKVDRAAMAVGLETRVPFLDHRVAELAARIPVSMKISGGKGKQIVRKLLYNMAPPALFERRKAGFGVPVGEWLRGPLRPWAEELLDPKRLQADGYFDAKTVRRRWQQHLRREQDGTPALWSVLMFQAWLTANERG